MFDRSAGTGHRNVRRATMVAGLAVVSMAIAPSGAMAAKGKLDAQLIAPIATKGKQVRAPVLLSDKSAKKLKTGKVLATLTIKRSKKLKAPSPYGAGQVRVAADSLRPGDRLKGKAKSRRSRAGLMAKVKAKKAKISSRESRFSNDELADGLYALATQLAALTLRVDELEATFLTELAALKKQLDDLAARFPDLEAQIDEILAQLAALESGIGALQDDLDALTGRVGDLETGLADAEAAIAALQGQIDLLNTNLTDLTGEVGGLDATLQATQDELDALQAEVLALEADVNLLCMALPLTCS